MFDCCVWVGLVLWFICFLVFWFCLRAAYVFVVYLFWFSGVVSGYWFCVGGCECDCFVLFGDLV